MPEIVIYSRTSDAGEHFLNFSIDGKKYVASHKKGKPGEPKAWLDEFEALLRFSKKYGLNPYATPLKSDPTKADKYKKRRMFDRVKYSWNDDESLKEGPRKGLKHFIDVIPKEKLGEHIVEKHSPEVEQMELKLAQDFLKEGKGMKDSCDQKSKDSDWGIPQRSEKFTPQRSTLHTQPTLEEMRAPVEEIINPYMQQPRSKQISEHSQQETKPTKINLPAGVIKKACIEKLDKLASYLESLGRIQEALEIDKISDKIEFYKCAFEEQEEFSIAEDSYKTVLDALTKKFGKVGMVAPEYNQYGHTWKNGIALRNINHKVTLYIPKSLLKDPIFKTLPMSRKKEEILY